MIIFDGSRKLYKGNLHLHTTMSDGKKTVDEACAIYRENGYDFLAVTDHRKISTDTEMKDGLLLIKGVEFDFFMINQAVHIVAVGADKSVMENLPAMPAAAGPQRVIDEIHKAGGVAILAHPAWSLNTLEVINGLRHLDGVEIYNTASGMPFNGDRADSSCILDVAFVNGKLINLVAADDSHWYQGEHCKSYIMAAASELTEEGVKGAIRKGDFYASQGPEFHRIEMDGNTVKVWCSPVKYISFPSETPWVPGRTLFGENLTYGEFTLNENTEHKFIRVMLVDEEGRRAWSNPIDLENK